MEPGAQEWLSTWGPTYAEATFLLFIFILGVPALLLQSITPPSLQRLIRRTFRYTRFALAVPVLILITFTVFLGLGTGRLRLYGIGFLDSFATDPSVVSTLLFLLLALLVGLVTWRSFKDFGFFQVTEAVRQTAVRQCRSLARLGGKPTRGFLHSLRGTVWRKRESDRRKALRRSLESLAFLGEVARGREENRAALAALQTIAETFWEHRGCQRVFDGIVKEFSRAVRRTVSPPEDTAVAEYKLSFQVLQKARNSFSEAPRVQAVLDQASERIARQLVAGVAGGDSEEELRAGLPLAMAELSRQPVALMELGVQCLRRFPNDGSLRVLANLQALGQGAEMKDGEEDQPENARSAEEHRAALLGLAARIRASEPVAKRWIDETFSPSLDDAILSAESMTVASRTLFDLSKFAEASAVEEWCSELVKAQANPSCRELGESEPDDPRRDLLPSVTELCIACLRWASRRVDPVGSSRRPRSRPAPRMRRA